MNINKNLLLATAIIGIGLFVLPSTLSMFAGQHTWYDPNDEIPCEKCHFLEKQELNSGAGPHSLTYSALINISAQYNSTGANKTGGSDFWGSTDDITDRCYGCHQRAGTANTTWGGFAGEEDQWDTLRNQTHAAYAVLCLDCHPWVETELKNDSAAHKAFYEDLANDTSTVLQNKNKACLGCHTHVGMNISWERNEYVSYNVTCNKTGYVVTWNASDELGTNISRFNSSDPYIY